MFRVATSLGLRPNLLCPRVSIVGRNRLAYNTLAVDFSCIIRNIMDFPIKIMDISLILNFGSGADIE